MCALKKFVHLPYFLFMSYELRYQGLETNQRGPTHFNSVKLDFFPQASLTRCALMNLTK